MTWTTSMMSNNCRHHAEIFALDRCQISWKEPQIRSKRRHTNVRNVHKRWGSFCWNLPEEEAAAATTVVFHAGSPCHSASALSSPRLSHCLFHFSPIFSPLLSVCVCPYMACLIISHLSRYISPSHLLPCLPSSLPLLSYLLPPLLAVHSPANRIKN